MRNSCIFALTKILLIVVFVANVTFSQTTPLRRSEPTLLQTHGSIQLPDGFIHERRCGIDSTVGAIIRSDGFTIGYDIGKMAGNRADQYFPEHFEKLKNQKHLNPKAIEMQIQSLQNQIKWRQRQKVNGNNVMVVLLKDSTLIASFVSSNTNFIATTDSDDKIADFFLIVLTYLPNSDKRN